MGIGLGIGINRSNYAQGIFNAYQSRVVADGGVTEAGACVDAVSGLLLTASLLLIPSGYKSGKAYAQIPTNGNGDLTWTRASTSVRTDSSGLLESMATGVPRLSYMYGSCPALLLEPQRTNLALYSEQFNDATWGKNAVTITANTTTAPNGTTTADSLVGDGSTNNHRVELAGSITSGTIYTVSIYAKKNTNDFLQIFSFSSPFGVNVFANFNLNTGVVGTVGSSTTASITNVGDGWYRCVVTGTATSTGSFALFGFSLITSATAARAESNTLSTSVFLWGAQLELGAYPTTYIPTTSASATRVADSFSRNNIYTNGLITSSGGTWFVELRGNLGYTRDAGVISLYIGDASSSPTNTFEIRNGGGTNFALSIGKRISNTFTTLFLTTTSTVKIAIKWNGTNADLFVNGVKEVTATAFAITNMDFLIGNGNDVPKFIQSMALYPTPLTDTQCQTLTTL
jgi:hypothetical protein